jgi:hypothetical protein
MHLSFWLPYLPIYLLPTPVEVLPPRTTVRSVSQARDHHPPTRSRSRLEWTSRALVLLALSVWMDFRPGLTITSDSGFKGLQDGHLRFISSGFHWRKLAYPSHRRRRGCSGVINKVVFWLIFHATNSCTCRAGHDVRSELHCNNEDLLCRPGGAGITRTRSFEAGHDDILLVRLPTPLLLLLSLLLVGSAMAGGTIVISIPSAPPSSSSSTQLFICSSFYLIFLIGISLDFNLNL